MPHPSWSQVTAAFSLVAFNSAISHVLQLDLGASLVIDALRYMAQLTVVTFVLRYIFVVESIWAVARLTRRFPTYCCKSDTLTVIHSPSTTEYTWRI